MIHRVGSGFPIVHYPPRPSRGSSRWVAHSLPTPRYPPSTRPRRRCCSFARVLRRVVRAGKCPSECARERACSGSLVQTGGASVRLWTVHDTRVRLHLLLGLVLRPAGPSACGVASCAASSYLPAAWRWRWCWVACRCRKYGSAPVLGHGLDGLVFPTPPSVLPPTTVLVSVWGPVVFTIQLRQLLGEPAVVLLLEFTGSNLTGKRGVMGMVMGMVMVMAVIELVGMVVIVVVVGRLDRRFWHNQSLLHDVGFRRSYICTLCPCPTPRPSLPSLRWLRCSVVYHRWGGGGWGGGDIAVCCCTTHPRATSTTPSNPGWSTSPLCLWCVTATRTGTGTSIRIPVCTGTTAGTSGDGRALFAGGAA